MALKKRSKTSANEIPDTLKEVAKALAEIEMRRTEAGLAPDEAQLLEQLSLSIRMAERTLIKQRNTEWVKLWKTDYSYLQELVSEARSAGRSLSSLTAILDRINLLLRNLQKMERDITSKP